MAEVTAETPRNPVVIRNVGLLSTLGDGGISCIPYLNTVLEAKPEDRPKALVISVEVSGASPDSLNPYIKRCVNEHIPVFLVSKHYGDEKGTQVMKYDTHKMPTEAGAILLKEVNTTHMIEVAEKIQTEIDKGKTGTELSRAIVDQYGTPPFEDQL